MTHFIDPAVAARTRIKEIVRESRKLDRLMDEGRFDEFCTALQVIRIHIGVCEQHITDMRTPRVTP